MKVCMECRTQVVDIRLSGGIEKSALYAIVSDTDIFYRHVLAELLLIGVLTSGEIQSVASDKISHSRVCCRKLTDNNG